VSIQFKRSTVSGVLPTATNMYQGELAINMPDQKLYTMDNNNNIINIGFSKDEADSTFLALSGGTISGNLELTSGTPYIDFHYNNSTADYTSRIIASGSSTLQILSTTINLTGNTIVTGNETISGGLTVTGNVVTSGTATITGAVAVSNKVQATTFRANSGTPSSDTSTVGYSFDSNGDTGIFYENPSTSTYGGTLAFRNDGTLCLNMVNGLVFTGADSTVNSTNLSKGTIELYTATPYIDFHYGNSTADYTSRIIASASGTLELISSLVKTSSNFTSSGTVTAGYITSTGNVNATSGVTCATVTASGKVRAAVFRATSGTPSSDSASVGYAFEDNGDSGMFYENETSSIAGGDLVFRNDSVNAMHIRKSDRAVSLNVNTYYKGTLLETLLTNNKVNIAILLGTVGDGGYTPVPSGYSRSQCYTSVWPWQQNHRFASGDAHGHNDTRTEYCTINNSTGYVRVYTHPQASPEGGDYGGTAGYMVIGIK